MPESPEMPGVRLGPVPAWARTHVDPMQLALLIASWRCAVATCVLLSRDVELHGEALTDMLGDKTLTALQDTGALLGEMYEGGAYEDDD